MSQQTVDKIWSSMLADKSFIAETPAGKPLEVFHRFIHQLLTALGDQLDAPVTLESIISAKITTAQCYLDTKFVEELIPSYPKYLLLNQNEADLIAGMVKVFELLIETLQETLPQINELFPDEAARADTLEHDFNLNPEMLKVLKQGTLTIRTLLEQQPMVLLKGSE